MSSLRLPLVLGALAVVAGVLGYVFLQGGDAGPEIVAPEIAPRAAPKPVDEPTPTPMVSTTRAIVADDAAPIDSMAADPEFAAGLAGLTGRVVELDGTPVAKINVELVGVSMDEIFADPSLYFRAEGSPFALSRGTVKTGDDGRFLFEKQVPDQLNGLGIDLRGPRSSLRFVDHTLEPGQLVDIGDIVMQPTSTFTGTIVDGDGKPVAGARVRVTNLPAIIFQFGVADLGPDGGITFPDMRVSRSERDGKYMAVKAPPAARLAFDRLPIPETSSDEAGKFELTGVPPGLVSVLVNKADFVTLVHGPVPSGAAGAKRDLGTLRVDSGEALMGTVVDSGGRGVAGCEVMVGAECSPFGETFGILRPFGSTDSNGAFQANGLADVSHFVAVRKPGAVDWLVVAGQQPGIDEPVLKLEPVYDVTLKCVDERGTIVPNPQVLVAQDKDMFEAVMVLPPVRVDAKIKQNDDGTVTIAELGSSHYCLAVRAEDYAATLVEVDVSRGPAQVTAVLKAARRVDVRVTAAATEKPVANASVALLPKNMNDSAMLSIASARTDKDGAAALRQAPFGEVVVRVSHPKYAPSITRIKDTENSAAVALVEGGTLVGHVHSGGKPIDQPRMLAITKRGRDNIAMPRFATTDLEGNFKVTHVMPGDWEINVLPRFANDQGVESIVQKMFELGRPERDVNVTIVDATETRIEIDLLGSFGEGPKGQLRGRVTMNGAPAIGATVATRKSGDWGAERKVKTDSSGQFDCGEVPAADLIVTITPVGVGSEGRWGAGFYMKVIAIPAGGIVDEQFQLQTGALAGRVLSDTGDPVPMARVTLKTKGVDELMYGGGWEQVDGNMVQKSAAGKSATRLHATTDVAGNFMFDPAPTTECSLSAEANGFTDTPSGPHAVTPGNTLRVEIRMKRAVKVSGHIAFPAGMGADGNVWLSIARQGDGEGSESTGVSVDEKGNWSTDELGPGEYVASVQSSARVNGKWTWYQYKPFTFSVPTSGIEGMQWTAEVSNSNTYDVPGDDG